MDKNLLLSSIPKVDEILNNSSISNDLKGIPHKIVIKAVREALDETRKFILGCPDINLMNYKIDIENILKSIKEKIEEKSQRHLKRVINGTGVILHTNLGRAVLCKDAIDAVLDTAQNYCNLEYDIASGFRGSRYSHLEYIISEITGAESAMAVNNNAAAILLALCTLCKGKEAIVSRGELVEIGDSFRVPEVMELSGALLMETGTTNKTHIYDYESLINENTGVLLKVHTSNYRILGFTESVSISELVSLSIKREIPVVLDIGSGSFIDFSKYGFCHEPTVQEAIDAGVDVITFSGDKMLGGPQAGIIAGKKKYIDMMKKNPLTRALRLDKMTIAALEATLRKYLDLEKAVKEIPTVRMIVEPTEIVYKRAELLSNMLQETCGSKGHFEIVSEHSQVGGGAMPLENIPTFAVAIKPCHASVKWLEENLRKSQIPIIVRIQNDNIIIDMRTVIDDDLTVIESTISNIL